MTLISSNCLFLAKKKGGGSYILFKLTNKVLMIEHVDTKANNIMQEKLLLYEKCYNLESGIIL